MPNTERDDDLIENGLDTLCKTIVNPEEKSYATAMQYIYVHEYQLALDLIAHIQLQSESSMSSETRTLFEMLAQKIGMTDGDMWRGVAKLRSSQLP